MTGEGHAPKHPAGSVFVGRDRELDELRAGLRDAASGRGRMFMLAGEAGVGKTRLADELAAEATRHGAQVLWGCCWEGGGAPPYWPWVQIIRTALRDRDPEVLAAQLGAGASDVAQFVPEVRERLPQLPVPPPLDSDEARFRLFDSSTAFLRNVAAVQPAVLIFDDLHAADMPSLLLLRFVARELRTTPLLVIALYREAEVRRTAGLAEMFGELARESHRLSLRGFSEAEVGCFIERALQGGAHAPEQAAAGVPAAAIHRATDGNPFFVHEVVRWLAAEGVLESSDRAALEHFTIPDHVREAVRWRLRAVPGETQPLQAAAAEGAPPPHAQSDSQPVGRAGLVLSAQAGQGFSAAAPRRLAYELGRVLAQQRDLEQLLSLATAKCREIFDAEGVAVLLLDRERDELYFPYVAEEKPLVATRLRQIRFPADRGFAGAALQRGKALRSDDVSADPLFFAGVDQFTGRTTRALLCAPLTAQHGAIGVVEAVNPCDGTDFDDDDLALLDAVAHTIAEAIERARHGAGQGMDAGATNVFCKQGEYWVIAYDDRQSFRLKDAKGLAYIAHLLCHPGQEFHAVDLVRAGEGRAGGGGAGLAASAPRRAAGEALRTTASLGDAGELLDAQARAAYKQRLADLREDLEDAQACNDLGRAGRAQHEIEFLTQELVRAVGLGGRERRAGSHAEHARVNVSRAIAVALHKIAAHHPGLGHHFARTIKTGTFCVYVPDPRVPITWEL